MAARQLPILCGHTYLVHSGYFTTVPGFEGEIVSKTTVVSCPKWWKLRLNSERIGVSSRNDNQYKNPYDMIIEKDERQSQGKSGRYAQRENPC